MRTHIALHRERDRSVTKVLEVHLHGIDGPIDVARVAHDARRMFVKAVYFPDFKDVEEITAEQAIALGMLNDEGFAIRLPMEAKLTLDLP